MEYIVYIIIVASFIAAAFTASDTIALLLKPFAKFINEKLLPDNPSIGIKNELVGKTAIAICDFKIDDQDQKYSGRIEINGTTWSALYLDQSTKVLKGAKVVITSIDGTTLIVKNS